ncbi:MAG: nuclear transport factor 2 family protein [Rhodopirellula sp.]|nr:nuclear transport factor 2 family protein [Rhodopirellula sp.]
MWFTEDAWSPIILCTVIAAIFFIAFMTTQRARFLLALPLLLLVAITIYFVEIAVVTDSEQVEKNLLDLVNTFVEESHQFGVGSATTPEQARCQSFFAESNTVDRTRVVAALMFVQVEGDIRVTDVKIQLTNKDTMAVTHFRANATFAAGSQSGHHPSRWEMTWQKQAGEWKITRTKMLNVVNGQEMQVPGVDGR